MVVECAHLFSQDTRHEALASINDIQKKYDIKEVKYENKGEFLPKLSWEKLGWPTTMMDDWLLSRPQV